MNFAQEIKKAVQIVKLDNESIREVSNNKDSMLAGIIIVLVGAFLNAVVMYIKSIYPNLMMLNNLLGGAEITTTPKLSVFIIAPLSAIIGLSVAVGIYFIIAKILGGTATYTNLFLPISYSGIILWLSILKIIPVFGSLIYILFTIWILIVAINIIREVFSLSQARSVTVVISPIIIILLLTLLVLSNLDKESAVRILRIYAWEMLNF